jgi:hypothetical protein
MTTVDFDPGPPPASDFTVRLTDAQVDGFHRDGFTYMDRITTDEELEWLVPLYDHLFARKGAWRGGYFDLSRPYESEGDDFVPQVLAPEVRYPQLRETTLVRNAIAIGAQLLGVSEDTVKTWSHMILKPPEVGGELPWHQDEAYWDTGMRYRAVGCWVPLDPATVDSGCLHFVPGSHVGEVRRHRHIGDDPNVHGLVTDGIDDAAGVAVPLQPGGASFHHCRTLHRSTPNVSGRVRRAWANEVQLDPEPLADDDTPDRPWVREGKEAWERRALR